MIIQSKRVYFEEKLQPRQVVIEDGKIKAVLPYGLKEGAVDYGDLMILPGLVDVHNHGYDGLDTNHATVEWLEKWMKYLPSEGVTATLATISSNPKENLLSGLNSVKQYMEHPVTGAHLLGVYEEGPFISQKFRGAQSWENKITASKEAVDEFNEACGGHLVYVMIAVEELNEDYSVVSYCRDKGMKVALGHTGATFAQCEKAIEHGATSFTHTFNGMLGLHHREPGTAGAAMYFDDCYAELICDGIHVEKHVANILAKTKGKDKLILVTDSVAIKGLKPGIHVTKGRTTYIGEDGVGRLENGTLAGSCNKMNHILDFAIHDAGIDVTTAINASTVNPCRMLGVNTKGLIAEGYDADIAVFDDRFNTQAIYLMGEKYEF